MFLEQAKGFAKKAALFALAAVLAAAFAAELPPCAALAAGSSRAADPEAPKDEPKISAKSAVVINADDGTVVYAKNEHERLAIASTTKIMTALLTLEAAEQNDKVVTITSDMVRVEGSWACRWGTSSL